MSNCYYFVAGDSIAPQVNNAHEILIVERSAEDTIDEIHPIVQKLLNAKYPLEQSIKAVEKCKTLQASLDYLDDEENCETKDDIFPMESSSEYHRENSQESSDMEW